MQQAINGFYRFLELLLVILLAGMVIMVFGNVTLRYVFNSGWTVSEEFSRFFFVWLTFVGAVVAFREYSHMGIETLVVRLSRKGRLLCLVVGNLIIMGCSFIFAWGALEQLEINASMRAPVSGMPLSWVYGIGIFTGGAMFVVAGYRCWTALTGRMSDAELARFAGEVDDPAAEHV